MLKLKHALTYVIKHVIKQAYEHINILIHEHQRFIRGQSNQNEKVEFLLEKRYLCHSNRNMLYSTQAHSLSFTLNRTQALMSG